MKKRYEKPQVMIENYCMTDFIASGCSSSSSTEKKGQVSEIQSGIKLAGGVPDSTPSVADRSTLIMNAPDKVINYGSFIKVDGGLNMNGDNKQNSGTSA